LRLFCLANVSTRSNAQGEAKSRAQYRIAVIRRKVPSKLRRTGRPVWRGRIAPASDMMESFLDSLQLGSTRFRPHCAVDRACATCACPSDTR
jgi:hypothetical protein